MIVTEALRKLGTKATAAELRDYISKIQGLPSIDGTFDFVKVPQRGLDDGNALVTRWDPDKGNWVVLSQAGGMPIAK